jgi:SRSO17 transposase
VSVHAVGAKGTVPLGWALYLPEEWAADAARRKKAKIPESVSFETKPELGVGLVERAAGWGLPAAPVLGDSAYGDNTGLRERLHDAGREYVLSVGAATTVFAPETVFAVPEPDGSRGRPKSRPRPDRDPEAIGELIARLGRKRARTVSFRDGPDGKPIRSRFVFMRVRAAHNWEKATPSPPREEWLIAEWPTGKAEPTDYWISNLPANTKRERLARLARLRWKIELDYKQLKGELGLDHYEGRSWIGWHHHTALVTAAHAFLTLERLDPKAQRPA